MRIGTRRSALALAQAELVSAQLGGCELVPIAASGDGGAGSDKERWVDTIESALRAGEVDLAVHSAKDLPVAASDADASLVLIGATARASAADVICGAASPGALATGARVGTSSLRRMAQLRALRDDLDVIPLHGNVDTRLRKLDEGADGVVAIVLAQAGLQRLGLEDRAGGLLDVSVSVPAPGQGALALQARAGDREVADAVTQICDAATTSCLLAERALARELGASCNTPLGAHAVLDGQQLELRGWAGLPDGSAYVSDRLGGPASDPEGLAATMARRMLAAGAGELLLSAEREAAGGR